MAWGLARRLDSNDILVVEVTEDLDLAQRALHVGQVLKRLVDLLDGNLLAIRVVHCRADDAVGTVSNRLHQRVARVHVEACAADHEGG